jgi:hypothetical protein
VQENNQIKGRSAKTTKIPLMGITKEGGLIKSSASKRADGIAIKGKTKGRMV